MNRKRNLIYIYSSAAFIIITLAAGVLFRFISPSHIGETLFSVHLNQPERADSVIRSLTTRLILLGFIALLFTLCVRYYLEQMKKLFSAGGDLILRVLNFRFLFITILVYTAVLFFIAVTHYDWGTDEVSYPLYAKHFWSSGFAFCLNNGSLFIIDNYAMLPLYLFSGINFLFGLTDVWHFKLLMSLLSLCSVFIVSLTALKLHNKNTAVLFLFLLVIQPGFGFVASSFFGEVVQAGFFFAAVYMWLKDDAPVDRKKIFLVSLLFALAIQTKFQLSQSVILSLIIFHFVDNKRKAIPILITTIAIVITIALLRLVPAVIFNKGYLIPFLKFWASEFFESAHRTLLISLDRAQFFGKFLSFILAALLLGGIFMWAKKPHEKFLALFTLFYFVWWIVYFWLSNYRVLFIGIIPFCFLLAAFAYDFYAKHFASGYKPQKTLIWISSICIIALMAYGYSINIIYAYGGNNDAVQFDLDGSKSRLYLPVTYDNSQKEFYREAGKILQNADSVYIASGGQASLVPQYYLGEYKIFDKEFLKRSVENSPGAKYVIIDRTAFPLGLEEGYNVLDAMNLHRSLLFKYGEYELYSAEK